MFFLHFVTILPLQTRFEGGCWACSTALEKAMNASSRLHSKKALWTLWHPFNQLSFLLREQLSFARCSNKGIKNGTSAITRIILTAWDGVPVCFHVAATRVTHLSPPPPTRSLIGSAMQKSSIDVCEGMLWIAERRHRDSIVVLLNVIEGIRTGHLFLVRIPATRWCGMTFAGPVLD